jgi:DNA-binding protein HU-beta
MVDDTLRILEEHFAQGNPVNISSFGTLEVKKKMERISVNPTTGKRYLIPPKLVLSFKQSNILKEKFNAE